MAEQFIYVSADQKIDQLNQPERGDKMLPTKEKHQKEAAFACKVSTVSQGNRKVRPGSIPVSATMFFFILILLFAGCTTEKTYYLSGPSTDEIDYTGAWHGNFGTFDEEGAFHLFPLHSDEFGKVVLSVENNDSVILLVYIGNPTHPTIRIEHLFIENDGFVATRSDSLLVVGGFESQEICSGYMDWGFSHQHILWQMRNTSY